MRSNIASSYVHEIQSKMYQEINTFSRSHEIIGRLGIIPVTIIDNLLEVAVKVPCSLIENIAFAILNVLGAACFKQCTLEDAFSCITQAVVYTITRPFKRAVLVIPHLLVNIYDPFVASSATGIPPACKIPKIFYYENSELVIIWGEAKNKFGLDYK